MRDSKPAGNMLWSILLFFAVTISFYSCGDISNVEGPPAPAQPGPLTILTSSPLPAGTVSMLYDNTLAHSGGTPPYTWSLAAGSPTLPNGLVLNHSTGNILGTPTTTGTVLPEFKLKDSTGKSVQKVLSITVNAAPIPLAILTNSITPWTINQFNAFALSPNGGQAPYTWNLKAGSTPLPSGLTLSNNGVISGTPTVTSNATHIFTLTDATPLTIEKSLQLSVNAIPLSITTNSLPQGTGNQNYSATLAASGGTGAYTWGLAGGSQALPNGLTLTPSTGVISGVPTSTGSPTPTFTVTDSTPPTPQTATKALQLIIGAAPPTLTITTPNPLPPGTVLQPYNFTLTASGGTGAQTWDLASGSLPVGLNLSSAGVITGTPTTTGTFSRTFRVRDSGSPQQTATKQLSITISNPAAPNITTPSLPAGSFNVAYNQTVQVTGGIGTLFWGVISGGLPPGLTLNSSNGNISGTPTSTGSFPFTLQVTDQIPQSDQKSFTIVINPPAPPTITTPSPLPPGTVNQTYPPTTLTASGGTAPLIWDPVVSPALPNGLSWDAATHTISGIPLNGSQGTANHTFTVRDSTNPVLTATKALSLTISLPTPPNITTTTASLLPNGMVGTSYSRTLAATGGTGALTWSLFSGTLPTGLNPISSTGVISGMPTAAGTFTFTPQVTDTVPLSDPTPPLLSITIDPAPIPLTITTNSPLLDGQVGLQYSTTLTAAGGTPPYSNWGVTPALPSTLTLDPSTGEIAGIPDVGTEGTASYTFSVQDSTSSSVNQPLSLTINP